MSKNEFIGKRLDELDIIISENGGLKHYTSLGSQSGGRDEKYRKIDRALVEAHRLLNHDTK